jgi:hypothetical protein
VIEARAVPFLGGPAVVVGSEKIAKVKNGEFPKVSTDGSECFASCFLELLDGGLGAFRSGAGKGTASKNLTGSWCRCRSRRALTRYKDFLVLRKDADPDILIYRQDKAEYARLQY